MFPQYVFLSPIDAMKPLEHLLDYDTILSQTLELLKRSDGLILTGRWQKSHGCQAIITWKDVQRSGAPAVYRSGAWYCPACAYDLEKNGKQKDTKGEVR